MAVATFDFTNLRIILPAGDVTIEVERDLYSAWKRAARQSPANMGAPPAFRVSVGGDPLGSGLEAGAYFFLQNQDGWRIRPAEADATVTLTGNIVAEDPAQPLTTPTLGAFTVLINGLQPITQGTSEILDVSQQTLYMSTVFYDTIAGVAGTAFPTGTAEQPSNNLTDALAIMTDVGATTLSVRGLLTLDQDFTKKKIVGTTNTLLDRVSLAGFDVDETTFISLEVAGTGQGTIAMERCLLDNIDGMVGEWKDCGFLNNVTLATGTSYFIDCWSAVQGDTKPTMDCNNVLVSLGMRRYTGGLQVINSDNVSNLISLDLVSSAAELAATVTEGDIVVRGVGTLNQLQGANVVLNKDGFVDGLDVKLIKALDAGNVTVTGSNPFVVEVLDPDDDITPIARFDISADGRTRTRTL